MKCFQFLLVFLPLLILADCKSYSLQSRSNELENIQTSQNDSVVLFKKGLSIRLPGSFSIINAVEDDTHFFEARNINQSIIMSYEYGAGKAKINPSNYLNKKNLKRFTLRTTQNKELNIYYEEQNASFRTIQGKVFITQEAKEEHILNFNTTKDQFEKFKSIIKTITKN
ncbi:hypothetical protein [Tenacibaculum sp. 190524A05c]|uniref:Lipoprotein n=1 Tax=Tenacibaculum platacis TaxID=3137852 RepID=A0ABM9NZJ8_9FLAO